MNDSTVCVIWADNKTVPIVSAFCHIHQWRDIRRVKSQFEEPHMCQTLHLERLGVYHSCDLL